jgi:hypothetical protein
MNKKLLFFVISMASVLLITACSDDEVDPPVITIHELGEGDTHGNDHTAIIGGELHMDVDIVAEGKINTVQVIIHPEGEHHKSNSDGEWELDTTYTKFSGLKNTNFHEHIEIDTTAEAGEYHFDFIVTDMEGNQSSADAELEILEPNDDIAPEITVSDAPTANQVFNDGETITITGMVSDDQQLVGMYIGLVREDQNLSDVDVNDANTITLLHTHDFDSPDSHAFNASINVGADLDNNDPPKDITGSIAWQSANYYIVVKCKDALGGNWTFSDHYPIIINY